MEPDAKTPAGREDAPENRALPPSPVNVHVLALVSGQRSVTGNPTGSPNRIREMLDVAARHGVKAMTESFPMDKANTAIDKVKKNKVRYRAVLTQ